MRTVLSALFLVFAVSVGPASAQPAWQNQIAVTGGAQLPTGPFDDRVKTGSGLAATYYYRPSTYFFFGLRGGFHRFQSRGAGGRLDVLPLQFASKLNLSVTGVQPYLGLDGGFYLRRPETGDGSSELGVAPKFGFRLPIASGVDIDLNATYEVLFTEPDNTTYLGLNAGFAYIFGR